MCLNNTLAQGGSNYTGIARQDWLRDGGSQASYHTHNLHFFLLGQVQTAADPTPAQPPNLWASSAPRNLWQGDSLNQNCILAYNSPRRVFFKGYVQSPLSPWELLASTISQGNFTAIGSPFC